MANKALGRDLGDLLSRAQPARIVGRAARSFPPVEAGPGERRADPVGSLAAPGAAEVPPIGSVATTLAGAPKTAPTSLGVPRSVSWWSRRLGYLLAADFVLLLMAAGLVFTDLADRSWAWPTALAAVVAGGVLGLLGLRGPVGNRPAPPPPPPSPAPGNPRIRVQLKR